MNNFSKENKMNTILSYDVSDKQTEVKAALLKMGFKDVIEGNNRVTCWLPNTTLWIEYSLKSPKQAKDDLKIVCSSLKIELIRAIAVAFEEWAGVTGKPHTD